MNLYLVRHGEAKSKEEDTYRHLTEKGIADIKKVASFLAKHNPVKVNGILHSGKRRAHQTAEILAGSLNPVNGISRAEALDPMADPLIWVKKIAEMQENIMLVGHLPHLNELFSYLLLQDEMKNIINFPAGGILCFDRSEDGVWIINWMLVSSMRC